jgi:hypothetical protein
VAVIILLRVSLQTTRKKLTNKKLIYPIEEKELDEALKNTNSNTTPGIDGINKPDIEILVDCNENKKH